MVGTFLHARNGESGVSVSNVNVGARVTVAVGCDAAGDAVHVAGSCNCVGTASVGPSGCLLQVRYACDAL